MRLLDPFGWPLHTDPADPWDGPSTLPDPDSSWEDHQTWTPSPLPDRDSWVAEDALWQRLLWQVLQGERPMGDPELRASAERLGIAGPRTHDGRPLPRAPFDPPMTLAVDLVENWVPDLAAAGLDFVLGPWADLDPSRALRELAGAVMLYARVHRHGRRTFDAWARDKEKPGLSERRALKALYRAPPMLWDCSTPCWKPLLPLMRGALPDAPVEGTPLPLTDGPIRAVVARVVPIADGRWVAHTPLGLPHVPPQSLLLGRLGLVLWRERRTNRRASWEDGLRARAEVLYRTCATWCLDPGEET